MKILIVGLYYSNNLGDAVICDCVAARLQEYFPAAQIDVRDFMDRHSFPPLEELSIRELDRRRLRMKLRRWASAYLKWDKQAKHEKMQVKRNLCYIQRVCHANYDLAVFAGGQIFADGLALYLEAFVRYLSEQGTPIFFNAAGTGPAASVYIRRHLSAALTDSSVKWISSRDDIDTVCRLYGLGKDQVIPTYDPALWCADVYRMVRDRQSGMVGLGMMYTNSISPRLAARFWIRMIRALERAHIPWKIFVNGSGSDISFAREILSRLPECTGSWTDYLAPVPRQPEELVRMLTAFRSIISFRLHSHIIAAALDIPSIAVVWDDKLRFFFQRIGCPERCCSVLQHPSAVLERLKSAEQEGYDRTLIQRQKECSDRLLYGAICAELQQIKEDP